MATKNSVSSGTQSNSRREVAQKYTEDFMKQRFAESQEAFKRLRDFTKKSNKTITTFDKETLRGYFQNITNNEANLRK